MDAELTLIFGLFEISASLGSISGWKALSGQSPALNRTRVTHSGAVQVVS